MRNYPKISLAVFLIFLLNACATYQTQIRKGNSTVEYPNKEIEHTFYLIGDGGNSPIGSSSEALSYFKNEVAKGSSNSTAIFLGDNIYQKGLPEKGNENRAFAEYQIQIQTEAVKDFAGKSIFIPGNHDWYSGLKGLKRQEQAIEKLMGKNTFLPENGCPIEKVDISEELVLIVIDSEWYLTNWNKHPTINDDCEIKTRIKFFEELEGLIKKARGKTTLIALHHPLFTNGPHGGQYSFGSHMKPLPVLGTLKNVIRKTGGVSPADLQNQQYNKFKKRVITLAQENEKVILVSGHEHSLQYLVQDNIPQIISGAGSKATATRNVSGEFTSSDPGFVRLDVFKDGGTFARFYSAKTQSVIYNTEVLPPDTKLELPSIKGDFPASVKASVYAEEEIEKSKFHKKIWGERYRKYYGVKVLAPTVNLDTIFGGLKPVRKGGGHQSKSLRLVNNEGKGYVMRALRKSATVYLQAMAFKDQYIEGQFDNTFTEGILQDFYTGSHPYAPFTTGILSDAVDLYHTNPVLYYVPKQQALAGFNDDFGNELYMIEEHVSDGHGDLKSFGFANKIESTDDLFKKLRKDEKYVVDEASFLRARLFDMLIGDWDRHVDQWRWAEFKEDEKVVYKPIPRDRDQAFSKMGDGALMNIATRIIPPLKLMEGFMDDVRNVKGFNFSPYSLDMALLNKTDKKQWDQQVSFLQKNLSAEVIDKAFKAFPEEVQGETVAEIKRVLLARLQNLPKIANDYYEVINNFGVITGTDKDDWFDIERMSNGSTKVSSYRILKGKKGTKFHERTYSHDVTKEIWIYGLDDKDVFHVYGDGDRLIKLRIIGGQNNDTYTVENGTQVKIYDHKSKKNTFTTKKGNKHLTDNYETNVYNYTKLKNSTNQFVPSIGSNPDDGFKFGFANTYTGYGFKRNPFTSQHMIAANYYFATNGYELTYTGEWASVIGNLNFQLDTQYNSPNYAINFFGFGNSTPNPEADEDDGLDVDLDFNRVRISTLRVSPGLVWRGHMGASFKTTISYEKIEVEETEGRFINDFLDLSDEINYSFLGASVKYHFANADNKAFPTLGMMFAIETGYKMNLDNDNSFAYLIPELGFDYKLVANGQLVLATKLKAHLNLGDDFEFYQGATLGANNGLRGYRNERFTGKSAFYQSTDLRLNLRKIKTGLLPLNIGFYGGFDYGRIWIDDNLVMDPAFNSNAWNTSIGGGVFANAADILTLQLSIFSSDDGARFAFGLGFGF